MLLYTHWLLDENIDRYLFEENCEQRQLEVIYYNICVVHDCHSQTGGNIALFISVAYYIQVDRKPYKQWG